MSQVKRHMFVEAGWAVKLPILNPQYVSTKLSGIKPIRLANRFEKASKLFYDNCKVTSFSAHCFKHKLVWSCKVAFTWTMTKNIYAILQLSAILVSLAVDVIGATGKQSAFERQQQTTVGQVENLRLINADTNLPILNITNNLVINLYNLNTNNFGIQATVAANSGTVGSIRFAYNDIPRYRTDSVTPFSLCPTTGGRNYQTCPVLGIGNHRVTATPYSNANASGTIGLPYQVTFQIIYVATTPAPITSNPTLAPIPLCRVPQVRKNEELKHQRVNAMGQSFASSMNSILQLLLWKNSVYWCVMAELSPKVSNQEWRTPRSLDR